MTTQTTPLSSPDRPRHPLLSVFLPSMLTLAAVLSLGVWLFSRGGPDAPATSPAVEQHPAAISEVHTGREQGGLAEMQEDLGPQSAPAATAPVPALGGPTVAAGAVTDQEIYSQWQAEQTGAAHDAPHPPQIVGVQVVYLAGSAEQAETIRRGITEAEAIRAAAAAPPLTVHTAVLVIGAGDEHILRGLRDAAAIRDSLDLPELVVVDLRTPAHNPE